MSVVTTIFSFDYQVPPQRQRGFHSDSLAHTNVYETAFHTFSYNTFLELDTITWETRKEPRDLR